MNGGLTDGLVLLLVWIRNLQMDIRTLLWTLTFFRFVYLDMNIGCKSKKGSFSNKEKHPGGGGGAFLY